MTHVRFLTNPRNRATRSSRAFALFADQPFFGRVSTRTAGAVIWIALSLLLSSCGVSMYDQPKFKPYERSDFFPDNLSARQPPPGTVPRRQTPVNVALETGQVNDRPVDTIPLPVTRELLARGQDRYNVFCAICHGLAGYGDGMIVQRGFLPPPNFHTDQIRNLPNGTIFNVISNGYGAMYPYGDRITPEDRWAIVAYIRALQLSQNATINDVPADQRQNIQGAPQ